MRGENWKRRRDSGLGKGHESTIHSKVTLGVAFEVCLSLYDEECR